MKERTITLCGKEVSLAYCFATEVAFHRLSGKGIEEFNAEDPDMIIYLILASVMASYQGRGEEVPLKDDDLLYKCAPKELIEALSVILALRAEWYKVDTPATDPSRGEGSEDDGEAGKNA